MASQGPTPFTCTFCFQPSDGPPHAIGRGARLSCSPCYAALIDLAICVPLLDLFDERRDADTYERSTACTVAGTAGKGNMREVEVPPRCAACYLGTEGEDVVQKGLRRVEKVDGGLSRARWDSGEGRAGQLRRAPAYIRSLSRDSSSLRRIGDGSHDESRGHLATPRADSTIYVSINDPMGQPAFKPSPTKPIPIWMQPFRDVEQAVNEEQRAPLASHPLVDLSQTPATSTSGTPTMRSTKSLTPTMRPTTPVGSTSPPQTPPRSRSIWTPSEIRRAPPLSWVSNEPLKRPSSRFASRLEKSDATTSSGYVTPPERPSEQQSRYNTPPPPQLRRKRPQSPLVPARVPRRHAVGRTPPPQSSEYLERYNPIRSPSPRPRIAQPVVAAFGQASRARASLALSRDTADATEDDGSGPGPNSNQSAERLLSDGADSPGEVGKKRNMQALRKLFGK
ncbi:hypothetical protein CORC01_02048 [Colletotrichum orchidophilum]|uniref:Uncharacterized protein n=1 Tax=Colletotrichum orchidophilum TaxID=1209926 RepID=A0A1G4BMG3_9PEZI|nr:uncharacterized protein CORC01_02048 [Colletotrichum orchidophilum]OHF02652.1 hypothetical protein CORC01_02048 [Colletotrichum orchidophilum]